MRPREHSDRLQPHVRRRRISSRLGIGYKFPPENVEDPCAYKAKDATIKPYLDALKPSIDGRFTVLYRVTVFPYLVRAVARAFIP